MSPSSKDPNATTNAKPGATSSAWADFMKEEGVDIYGRAGGSTGAAAAAAATSSGPSNDNSKQNQGETKKKKAAAKKKTGKRRGYNLEALEQAYQKLSTKKAKLAASAGGSLLQSGTLDVTVVGRKGMSKEAPAYQLQVPTRILPGIGITKVFTSCNACHSIALDASGQAYGWGRNDQGQLTSALPSNVATPTLLESLAKDYTMVAAALGKGHTLVLTDQGQVLAVGFNKMGQCGVKSSVETISQFKPCIFPPNVKIAQVCGGAKLSKELATYVRRRYRSTHICLQ